MLTRDREAYILQRTVVYLITISVSSYSARGKALTQGRQKSIQWKQGHGLVYIAFCLIWDCLTRFITVHSV